MEGSTKNEAEGEVVHHGCHFPARWTNYRLGNEDGRRPPQLTQSVGVANAPEGAKASESFQELWSRD
jgi:hypothetical protein